MDMLRQVVCSLMDKFREVVCSLMDMLKQVVCSLMGKFRHDTSVFMDDSETNIKTVRKGKTKGLSEKQK
jgi:hypothetical protein